jgi:hypothetical protein
MDVIRSYGERKTEYLKIDGIKPRATLLEFLAHYIKHF